MRVADCIALAHLKIDFGEESIGVTEEHPFWSEDRNGWVSARRLKVNEVVRSTGNKQVFVKSITRQKQATVYNLEVNRSHSYLVGKSRLVVHNGCGEVGQQRDPWGNDGKGPTNKEARREALNRGWREVKANFDSRGRPVFTDGKKFYSVDTDLHTGGAWKIHDRKGRRIGTADIDGKIFCK